MIKPPKHPKDTKEAIKTQDFSLFIIFILIWFAIIFS